MTYKLLAAIALALTTVAPAAFAGECEDNFSKSGSIFSGTDFSSRVTVPDLSVKDAMGQMRGIMIAEKMDVITEDAETGTMLVEQRSTNTTRAIPTLIAISGEGNAATVQMTVKTEKGQIAKADAMRPYMCQLLAKVKGGKEGRAAAAQGAKTQNNADVTVKDVYVFSREIAREAKGNAVAVTARHKGRHYALRGRVDYVQEDGQDYLRHPRARFRVAAGAGRQRAARGRGLPVQAQPAGQRADLPQGRQGDVQGAVPALRRLQAGAVAAELRADPLSRIRA